MNTHGALVRDIRVGDVLRLKRDTDLQSVKFRNDILEDDEVFSAASLDQTFYEGVVVVVIQTLETVNKEGCVIVERCVRFATPTLFKHCSFRTDQFEEVLE